MERGFERAVFPIDGMSGFMTACSLGRSDVGNIESPRLWEQRKVWF